MMSVTTSAKQKEINAIALDSEEATEIINNFVAFPETLDENGKWFSLVDGEGNNHLIRVKPDIEPKMKVEVFPMFTNTSKSLGERQAWSFVKLNAPGVFNLLEDLKGKLSTVETLTMFK